MVGSRTAFVALVSLSVPLAAVAEVDVEEKVELDKPSTQEISVTFGPELGGNVSPGGLRLQGAHLYRLNDWDWLETNVGLTFGSSGAGCGPAMNTSYDCNHGSFSGFGAEAGARLRRYFDPIFGLTPYAQVGLSLRWARFGDDGVDGIAIPGALGGGVRKEVADGIAVTGNALLQMGIGFYDNDLGVEPHAAFALGVGAEFAL